MKCTVPLRHSMCLEMQTDSYCQLTTTTLTSNCRSTPHTMSHTCHKSKTTKWTETQYLWAVIIYSLLAKVKDRDVYLHLKCYYTNLMVLVHTQFVSTELNINNFIYLLTNWERQIWSCPGWSQMYFIDKGDLELVTTTPPASRTLTLPTSASPSYFYEVLWLVNGWK